MRLVFPSALVAAAIAAALVAPRPASALITRDQAAQVDWHARHIGLVSSVASVTGTGLVTASAEDGVVAALDAATGAVRWRRTLDSATLIAATPLAPGAGDGAVTVTQEGGAVVARAWRSGDGGLVWQAAVGEGAATAAAVATTAGVAVVATDAAVFGLDAATGVVVWRAESPLPAGSGVIAARSVDGSALIALASSTGVAHIDAASGNVVASARASTGDAPPVFTGGGTLAFVRGASVCALHPPSDTTPRCVKPAAGACTSLVAGGGGAVAALCERGVAGVVVGASGALVASPPLAGTAAAVAPDGGALAVTLSDTSTLAVAGAGAPSEAVAVPGWSRPAAASAQPAAAAAAWVTPTPTGPLLIVRSTDGALAAVRLVGGAAAPLAWTRDDSLSRPASALFAPLPPPSASLPSPSHLPLATGIRMEWLALKSRLPRGVTAAEAGELASLRATAAGRSAPTADARGFRQAAVLLTRGGALAALHSGDGRPLWRAPGVAPAGVRATLLRAPSPSDAVTPAPILAVVWRGGYTLVDAHTGAVTEEGGHPLHAGALVPLPGSSAYLLVGDVPSCASCGGDGPRVAVWPPTEAARAAASAAAAAAPLRFWLADSDAGTLASYVVDWPPAEGAVAASRLAWRHAFGAGRLLATSASPPSAPRAAAARVMGDRSMKLRLAPDAYAFVASVDAGGAVVASIIDAASGQFVFRQAHAGVALPTDASARAAADVHAVWAGSTVVYTVRAPVSGSVRGGAASDGSGAPRPPASTTVLVGSLDLYDAARGTNLTATRLALGARPARDGQQASFAPPPPEVLRATFLLPAPTATALAVTSTERGITPPLFLVATPDGQAYGVPGAALDPRRPVAGATPPAAAAAAAAEGLPPYHPDVPLPPSSALTHGARVARPAGFAASPAGLESTSLILFFGLDSFGTRAQPASSFDRLPDDFPRALLLAVTAATLGGAGVLRAAAGREALKQAWR